MDREQLESAGPNYSYLRGLLSAPLGILFVIAALGNWEVEPLTHSWVFVACVLLVGVLCLAISRYYNEHYGRVTASSRRQARAALAALAGVALTIGVSLLLRSRAGWSLDLPVNPTAVSWALFMLLYYAVAVGLRAHHAVIFGVVLVAGLAPLWGGLGLDDTSNVGLLLAGASVVATGICDHRLLVASFGSPDGLSVENGDARA